MSLESLNKPVSEAPLSEFCTSPHPGSKTPRCLRPPLSVNSAKGDILKPGSYNREPIYISGTNEATSPQYFILFYFYLSILDSQIISSSCLKLPFLKSCQSEVQRLIVIGYLKSFLLRYKS